MKDGLRFVDCDMHIMEPVDLFERYLDARFKDRVMLQVGADGRPRRGTIVIDGLPTTRDAELQQYRKKSKPGDSAPANPGKQAGEERPPTVWLLDGGKEPRTKLRLNARERTSDMASCTLRLKMTTDRPDVRANRSRRARLPATPSSNAGRRNATPLSSAE